MKVLKIATVVTLGFMLSAGAALAQTAPPAQPPATPPPATQKPDPAAQKPAEPKPRPPAPFPEGAKVAFVNYDYVISASDEGKAIIAKLQDVTKKMSGDLAARTKKLEEAQKKAADQANLMNDQARAQAERELEKMGRDLEYAKQDAQNEFNEARQKLFNEFGEKMGPMLEAIAKEKGLQIVLRAVPEIMAYTQEGLDLSDELVKRLNAGAKTPPKK